jgi:hypothetical protein
MKSLSGKQSRPPPNQPISFNSKSQTKASAIARCFCKQYVSATTHRSNPKTRKVLRNLRSKHKLDSDLIPFTVQNVDFAIRASKNSTAVGPDGLTAIHLKHLGQHALAFLT